MLQKKYKKYDFCFKSFLIVKFITEFDFEVNFFQKITNLLIFYNFYGVVEKKMKNFDWGSQFVFLSVPSL